MNESEMYNERNVANVNKALSETLSQLSETLSRFGIFPIEEDEPVESKKDIYEVLGYVTVYTSFGIIFIVIPVLIALALIKYIF